MFTYDCYSRDENAFFDPPTFLEDRANGGVEMRLTAHVPNFCWECIGGKIVPAVAFNNLRSVRGEAGPSIFKEYNTMEGGAGIAHFPFAGASPMPVSSFTLSTTSSAGGGADPAGAAPAGAACDEAARDEAGPTGRSVCFFRLKKSGQCSCAVPMASSRSSMTSGEMSSFRTALHCC